MTEPWLTVKQGDTALLVSFPHTGLSVPAECAAALVSFPLARHDADGISTSFTTLQPNSAPPPCIRRSRAR